MDVQGPLPASIQIYLNGRAIVRDVAYGQFHKLPFHVCGLWRALALLPFNRD